MPEENIILPKNAVEITKTSSKKKRRHKRKKEDPFLAIPGVYKIILSKLVQKIIGCIAGENVTSEDQWIHVKREIIQDNLELHEDSSEFLPLKQEILKNTRAEILMGYIPTDAINYDKFYICVTESANDQVSEIIETKQRQQELKLNNSMYKSIEQWINLGSDKEIEENLIKNKRSLIEVELEAKYPIIRSSDVQFKKITAEDTRDGYMDIPSDPDSYTNVFRKRIDVYVQVTPPIMTTESQTTNTYPKNIFTNYKYEIKPETYSIENYKEHVIKYADSLLDYLNVNSSLNLYSNDFSNLAGNSITEARLKPIYRVFKSIMDVNLCKGKMITHAVFHPTWSGVVAIAYSDLAPNQYCTKNNTNDDIYRGDYSVNPVLIWSLTDCLKPKLILKCPREVICLSFCDFSEDLLVGGCKNGQVIIWDIKNKLRRAEESENLTITQQKYKNYMNSLMGWMKNVHRINIVKPTVVSDLRYSHKGPVTCICWSSPFHEFTKTGKFEKIESTNTSLQFISSSEDGTILIWDLLKKPIIQVGGFKRSRKLKHLKKKPSSLMADISPYHILHLIFRPLYKVYVNLPNGKKCQPITCIGMRNVFMKFEQQQPEANKQIRVTDRTIYKPISMRPTYPIEPRIHVGTIFGDYMHIEWLGQDFDSGEIINSEQCNILDYGNIHDGPVISLVLEPIAQFPVLLTVGGKIFGLWQKDIKNRPMAWRKSPLPYTVGSWNPFQPSKFSIARTDGYTELWVLYYNTKTYISSTAVSSYGLTKIAFHEKLHMGKSFVGYGDSQGTFRLYVIPPQLLHPDETGNSISCDAISKEIKRTKLFLSWQKEWNTKNNEMQENENNIKQLNNIEKQEEDGVFHKTQKPVVKEVPQGTYMKWLIQKRKNDEMARIRQVILEKKQLNTKELEKRRKPLQKLDEENEKKKQNQNERLKHATEIFNVSVSALFPSVFRQKSPPPPDPYIAGYDTSQMQQVYDRYLQLYNAAQKYINKNHYNYKFDWKNVLMKSRSRRQEMENTAKTDKYWIRYLKNKSKK